MRLAANSGEEPHMPRAARQLGPQPRAPPVRETAAQGLLTCRQ